MPSAWNGEAMTLFRRGCHRQAPGTTHGTTKSMNALCFFGVGPSAAFAAAPPEEAGPRSGDIAHTPRRGEPKKKNAPTDKMVLRAYRTKGKDTPGKKKQKKKKKQKEKKKKKNKKE